VRKFQASAQQFPQNLPFQLHQLVIRRYLLVLLNCVLISKDGVTQAAAIVRGMNAL